jgi:RNA polymerase sigma-70 factor (ECF subfamily)
MEVTTIYKEFHAELQRYVRSKVRLKEDAEDIMQNVFFKISSNVDKLTEDVKIKSWLFAVTRNTIIDYYRSKANKKNVAIEDEVEHLFDPGDSDPTKGLDQCIQTMIGLLPDDYRSIIIDSEINGIKQKDLAEKYGIPYPSMRSKIQRGRERLKQLFHNCCHIETDKLGNIIEAQGRADCEGPCKPEC